MPFTAIVIFRETLEIALILGIVLAATRGLPRRAAWIAGGFAAGTFGAMLVALFTQSISDSLEGMGQEVFNAGVLFTAAILIGWTVVWMRKNAREMSAHLKKVGANVKDGTMPLYTLSLIIGLAMLREGSEIVLFIYSMNISGETVAAIIRNTLIGLALGSAIGVMIYYGLLKIPARHALNVTSWLLVLLVAGLASQGAGFLSAAGYFSDFSQPVWDSSWLISDEGVLGQTLHGMMGYSAQPSAVQLLFYGVTLIGIVALIARGEKRNRNRAIAA